MKYVWTRGPAQGAFHQYQAVLDTLDQAADMQASQGGAIIKVDDPDAPLHLMIDCEELSEYTNDGRQVTVWKPVFPWDVLEEGEAL